MSRSTARRTQTKGGRDGEPVTIRFVNGGERPIVLEARCFPFDYLDVRTDADWQWPAPGCGLTCADVFALGCPFCVPCASGSNTVVMPGGSVETTWPGVLFEPVTPPNECYAMEPCVGGCWRARIEIADVVSATATAISHDACIASAPDPSACSCDDTKALTCETEALGFPGRDLERTALCEPGTPGPIEIVF